MSSDSSGSLGHNHFLKLVKFLRACLILRDSPPKPALQGKFEKFTRNGDQLPNQAAIYTNDDIRIIRDDCSLVIKF